MIGFDCVNILYVEQSVWAEQERKMERSGPGNRLSVSGTWKNTMERDLNWHAIFSVYTVSVCMVQWLPYKGDARWKCKTWKWRTKLQHVKMQDMKTEPSS